MNPPPAPAVSPTAEPPRPAPQNFGARAVSDFVLKVSLQEPAPNFPALAAHTVFRPVYETEVFPTPDAPDKALISNGPFHLAQLKSGEAVLERSPQYWDAATVKLERVRFVATKDAETALAMYRAGALDVVTNAGFEPLALKLLTPYQDFRRTTFSALNYYQFNPSRPPFDNVKVRQALALV